MKSSFALLLSLLVGLGKASSTFDIEDYLVHNPSDIEQHVFDYIIVGGGPAGLTAAARLTENPDISVLVVESGFWETDRSPAVFNLTSYGRLFGTNIDHSFTTRIQTADHRAHIINSGHGLGGSTLINGGAWTRPANVQVDAWEAVFGNDGWTWDKLVPFMKKAENVRAPTSRQQAAGQHFDSSCHGNGGPVHVGSLDTNGRYSPIIMAFMDTAEEMGVPVRNDLSCGNPRGVSMFPVTVTAEGKRCDAGRAWLLPTIQRSNLKVLVGQWVGKVLFDTSGDVPVAIGIQYGRYKGTTYENHVKFEVLLAAGALVSPLILEYSGIGLSHVLREAGVNQLVELPVGVNQQEQTNTRILNSADESGAGQGEAAYFASFNETFADLTPAAYALLNNRTLLKQWAGEVVARGGFHDAELLIMQYENYIHHLQRNNVAYSEILLDTWGELSFSVWNLLPFGRGYIHIRDSDPYLRDVDNDPQFFSNEFDLLGQAAATKLARKLSSKGPMAKYWKQELSPGFDAVPEDADIHAWTTWVKSNYRPNLHSVGTCSMMKRSLGGVVSNKARVYGTQALRVIDASIIPTQISSHMIAVLYGMVEKIVESILEDHDKAVAAQKQYQNHSWHGEL
ncbi:hypothetical protein GJ744_007381 [Endocarpon pusillum]|uniref:glucose oxidase n=1 Tax=Endocarpon pusillum TaxID=364733 RepID=A0A8H7ARL2_9EURO|nr:hypothetical protein GJ744_007381 [Endocarpon pusillum]